MAFRAVVAEIEAAAARLRSDRDRVARRVETLLDGGWSGGAAAAYGEGWAAWRAGADEVLAGLEAMTRLLDATEADFVGCDRGAGSSFDRLSARLGG